MYKPFTTPSPAVQPTDIAWDSTHRTVTDIQIASWNTSAAGGNKTYVVPNMGGRDNIDIKITGDRVIVMDAGDGSREGYVWDEETSQWYQDFDTDWANIDVNWDSIEDKPTTLSGYGITDALGESDVDVAATGDKIVRRNATGQIKSTDPVEDEDAVNKLYLETQIAAIPNPDPVTTLPAASITVADAASEITATEVESALLELALLVKNQKYRSYMGVYS